ncbi:hypothetical protein [Sporisorium scitamineum]|uniref:Uncharacterized protein n=1 Tax=Sporisorium scitamineum TaxID=49012 RepID=A0A0F7S2K2_9BASI|nr:hypothetical protein [Sporisorium scitamineum]
MPLVKLPEVELLWRQLILLYRMGRRGGAQLAHLALDPQHRNGGQLMIACCRQPVQAATAHQLHVPAVGSSGSTVAPTGVTKHADAEASTPS